jgi:hypothetical protein
MLYSSSMTSISGGGKLPPAGSSGHLGNWPFFRIDRLTIVIPACPESWVRGTPRPASS